MRSFVDSTGQKDSARKRLRRSRARLSGSNFSAGKVVIDVESEITHVYFVVTGRMQATLYDLLGKEIQSDTFVRGSVIGLFALGSIGPLSRASRGH